MKKLVTLLCMMVCSVMLFAQLKVDSIGRVQIKNYLAVGKKSANFTTNASLQISGTVPSSGVYYGVYSSLENVTNPTRYDCSSTAIYGHIKSVNLELAQTSSLGGSIVLPMGKRFVAAVAGIAESGAGIYGATGTDLPTTGSVGTYAGYFSGDVKVTGTITAATVSTTSDQRLKENIQSVASLSLTDGLRNLRPVAFNYKVDTTLFSYNAEAQEMRNTHYGLIAQEVQQIFPDIVYENQDGYLSINYTELVPLLIQSVQDLTEKVELLETQLANGTGTKQRKAHQQTDELTDIIATLYQNNPNPFTENTMIAYDLPLTTQSATLYIYDMSGVQLAQYDITSFGNGSLTVDGGTLGAGMYLYSLIADGKVIDTKRMILTKQ